MRYVLGIDSGGTHFRVRACDLGGTPLGASTGDSAAHYRFALAEVRRRIDAGIDDCLAQFSGARGDCAAIVCGSTGIDSPADRVVVEEIYRALAGFHCPIECVNDAEVALAAATGGTGVVVIAGTGSVAFGRTSSGETARSGGWPVCVLGDEGSGAWIARRALHHLTTWFDDRVASSALTLGLQQVLGVQRREQLMDVCIAVEHLTWQDPGLAATVDAAAEQGDSAAVAILGDAAAQTFALADTVVRRLGLHTQPAFTAGAWGSAIVRSRLHLAGFTQRMVAVHPQVEVRVAEVDAATGACRMALANVGG